MFNNDNSSMLWMLILFMLANNGANFTPPTSEEICEAFIRSVDAYMEDNKPLLEKAQVNSPLWQLRELREVTDKIDDPDTRIKILNVVMSIMSNIETVNKYACGGMPSCPSNPTIP